MISLLIIAILEFIIFATGTFGNVLTCIAVFKNQRLHSAACYCVLSLAVADLLTCSVLVLIRGLQHVGEYLENTILSSLGITVVGFIGRATLLVSFIHLALLSLDRVTAVSFPFFYQVNIKNSPLKVFLVLIFCWILPIVFTCIGDYVVDKKDSFVIFVVWVLSMTIVIVFSSVKIMIVVRRQHRFRQKNVKTNLSYRATTEVNGTAKELIDKNIENVQRFENNAVQNQKSTTKANDSREDSRKKSGKKKCEIQVTAGNIDNKTNRNENLQTTGKEENQYRLVLMSTEENFENEITDEVGSPLIKSTGLETENEIEIKKGESKVEDDNIADVVQAQTPKNLNKMSLSSKENPSFNSIKDNERHFNRCCTFHRNEKVVICRCENIDPLIEPCFFSNEKNSGDLQTIKQDVNKRKNSQDSTKKIISSPRYFNKEKPAKDMELMTENKNSREAPSNANENKITNSPVLFIRKESTVNSGLIRKDIRREISQEIEDKVKTNTRESNSCNEINKQAAEPKIKRNSPNLNEKENKQSEINFPKGSIIPDPKSVSIDYDQTHSSSIKSDSLELKNPDEISKSKVLLNNQVKSVISHEFDVQSYIDDSSSLMSHNKKDSVGLLRHDNLELSNINSQNEQVVQNVKSTHVTANPREILKLSTKHCQSEHCCNNGMHCKSRELSKSECTSPKESLKQNVSVRHPDKTVDVRNCCKNDYYLTEYENTDANVNDHNSLKSPTAQREPPCCDVTQCSIIRLDGLHESLKDKPIKASDTMNHSGFGEDNMTASSKSNNVKVESCRNDNDVDKKSELELTKSNDFHDNFKNEVQPDNNNFFGINSFSEELDRHDKKSASNANGNELTNTTKVFRNTDNKSIKTQDASSSRKQSFILSYQIPAIKIMYASDSIRSESLDHNVLLYPAIQSTPGNDKTSTVYNSSEVEQIKTANKEKHSSKVIDETLDSTHETDNASMYSKTQLNSLNGDKSIRTVSLLNSRESFPTNLDSTNLREQLVNCITREEKPFRENQSTASESEKRAVMFDPSEENLISGVWPNQSNLINSTDNDLSRNNGLAVNGLNSCSKHCVHSDSEQCLCSSNNVQVFSNKPKENRTIFENIETQRDLLFACEDAKHVYATPSLAILTKHSYSEDQELQKVMALKNTQKTVRVEIASGKLEHNTQTSSDVEVVENGAINFVNSNTHAFAIFSKSSDEEKGQTFQKIRSYRKKEAIKRSAKVSPLVIEQCLGHDAANDHDKEEISNGTDLRKRGINSNTRNYRNSVDKKKGCYEMDISSNEASGHSASNHVHYLTSTNKHSNYIQSNNSCPENQTNYSTDGRFGRFEVNEEHLPALRQASNDTTFSSLDKERKTATLLEKLPSAHNGNCRCNIFKVNADTTPKEKTDKMINDFNDTKRKLPESMIISIKPMAESSRDIPGSNATKNNSKESGRASQFSQRKDEENTHSTVAPNGKATLIVSKSFVENKESNENKRAAMGHLSIQEDHSRNVSSTDLNSRSSKHRSAKSLQPRRPSIRTLMISKEERKTAISVTVVLIAFIVLVYPRVILVFYNFFNPVTQTTRIVILWLRVLMYSNSAINPLLYAWRMPEFRKTFGSMLKRVKNRISVA